MSRHIGPPRRSTKSNHPPILWLYLVGLASLAVQALLERASLGDTLGSQVVVLVAWDPVPAPAAAAAAAAVGPFASAAPFAAVATQPTIRQRHTADQEVKEMKTSRDSKGSSAKKNLSVPWSEILACR